ncbi:MAG: MlaE family ABC transporter permease [Planctomycetota bacterium]|jgi:phospholipid/cholesterol/gamma-HCH transport system permease protein
MKFIFQYFQSIGLQVTEGIRGIGSIVFLLKETFKWAMRSAPDRKILIRQIHFVGVQSLPVVLTTGAFTGMVLAYSTYYEFQRLGVTSWVGPLVAKGLTQQLAPTLAGLMLAGRVGCAMAAELGYMSVSEQIDALKTMGVNPIKYLVVPRVIAFTAMTPLLTAFAMLIGITGGLGLTIYGLGAESHYIWTKTIDFMEAFDFIRGMTKGLVFGLSTSLICCYKGMNADGGAEGVGTATTQSNVASCITILVLNLFLTMVLGTLAN